MAKLLNSTSIIAVVLAARGGVGKSVIAAVLREALAGPDGSNKVQVLESDLNNSSMASIDKNALRVDLSGDKTGMGNAFLAVKRLVNDEAQAVVWDTPAGNEKLVVDLLRMVVAKLKKDMPAARVVVFRPITTSVFTQEFAVEFCKTARELGIAVVMVRNFGQGRLPEYYNDWDANSERAAAIKGGAEENDPRRILGAWVADEFDCARTFLRRPCARQIRESWRKSAQGGRGKIRRGQAALDFGVARTTRRGLYRRHGQGDREHRRNRQGGQATSRVGCTLSRRNRPLAEKGRRPGVAGVAAGRRRIGGDEGDRVHPNPHYCCVRSMDALPRWHGRNCWRGVRLLDRRRQRAIDCRRGRRCWCRCPRTVGRRHSRPAEV